MKRGKKEVIRVRSRSLLRSASAAEGSEELGKALPAVAVFIALATV